MIHIDRPILKVFSVFTIKADKYAIFGVGENNTILRVNTSGEANIEDCKSIAVNYKLKHKVVEQKIIKGSKYHILTHEKILNGPHLMRIEEGNEEKIKVLYKKLFGERIVWFDIAYFSEESFEYYIVMLSVNKANNKVSASLLTNELNIVLKTVCSGISKESISQIKWKNNSLSLLLNEDKDLPSKLVRMQINLSTGFMVKSVEELKVKVINLSEFEDYSLRVGISDVGQLLVFNGNMQAILSIDLISHSEKMQILKTPIKFTEEELTDMELKFGILQQERIIAFKVADVNEILEMRSVKLWVLTNYVIYLVQCNLSGVNVYAKDNEATSTVIDHILFSSLDIAKRENARLHWIDKDSILVFINNEVIKFSIRTVVSGNDFQIKRSIYIAWRKKCEVVGFIYNQNKDEIIIKSNNKLSLLQ